MGEIFAYGRIHDPSMELVPMTEKEKRDYAVIPGDLLFARQSLIAAGAGKCSIVLDAPQVTTFESHLIRVRLDQTRADPLFYYYYFSSPLGKASVQSIVMQVAAAGIRGSELALLPIPHPPLPTQRKIAAILSAYDDLIENNTRRIAILEDMARTLYREWFVSFRFPGHESVPLVDSPLGMIPEGWRVRPIGEAVETLGGGTPSTARPEYWEDGDVIWFTPSDLTSADAMFVTNSSKRITRLGLEKSSARLFPPYSVMMTSRATIGVTAINTKEACTNQGFVVCVPNEQVSVYQIYFWIEQNREAITSIASGATYKEISRGEFREFQIPLADCTISARFVEVLTPIGRQIENLLVRNANLRRTRDLLLPRLISGELDVSDLPIDTGGLDA